MRIHLTISLPDKPIPFNHQAGLKAVVQKWLGPQQETDAPLPLYSFSWLRGGQLVKQGVRFKEGASWFISAFDPALIKSLVTGIREDAVLWDDIYVKQIGIQDTPEFGPDAYCWLGSPILIKQYAEGISRHITYEDANAGRLLETTLIRKAEKAGIVNPDISIRFDVSYPKARTKVVYYRGVGNKVNQCPVILRGNPEMIAFAWDVGLGNSTGSGFGALI
ncbi:MAG: CRISPR-associated endoribonuclease Cas6 [Bacteroidia bacterium]|nr:CRISPR-associated endoribonuclease Cas6 [Bacteroidia bacterium]